MIEEIINQIASTVPAVCDEGWWYDAQRDFCQRKEWLKAKAFLRTDPSCLLELKSLVSEDVFSLVELRKLQQHIWQNMSGSRFEASSVVAYQEASVLRFVTVGKGNLYHLPGKMIVGGTHYRELVRRHENKMRWRIPSAPFSIDFSDLDEPLPSNEDSALARITKDWDEDELRIREIMTIIRRIDDQTRINKKDFLASRLVQDATRFNLLDCCEKSRDCPFALAEQSFTVGTKNSVKLWHRLPNLGMRQQIQSGWWLRITFPHSFLQIISRTVALSFDS